MNRNHNRSANNARIFRTMRTEDNGYRLHYVEAKSMQVAREDISEGERVVSILEMDLTDDAIRGIAAILSLAAENSGGREVPAETLLCILYREGTMEPGDI